MLGQTIRTTQEVLHPGPGAVVGQRLNPQCPAHHIIDVYRSNRSCAHVPLKICIKREPEVTFWTIKKNKVWSIESMRRWGSRYKTKGRLKILRGLPRYQVQLPRRRLSYPGTHYHIHASRSATPWTSQSHCSSRGGLPCSTATTTKTHNKSIYSHYYKVLLQLEFF